MYSARCCRIMRYENWYCVLFSPCMNNSYVCLFSKNQSQLQWMLASGKGTTCLHSCVPFLCTVYQGTIMVGRASGMRSLKCHSCYVQMMSYFWPDPNRTPSTPWGNLCVIWVWVELRGKGAIWTAPKGALLGMSHWADVPGKTQDTPEGLCLPSALGVSKESKCGL